MKTLISSLFLACAIMAHAQTTFENIYDGGGGGEVAYGVDTVGDGGVVICGELEPKNNGIRRASIIREDAAGAKTWGYTYGSAAPSGLMAIVKCASGFAATGYAYNEKTQRNDLLYMRIDGSGMLLAGPIYFAIGGSNVVGNAIIELSNGDFAICGRTEREQLLVRISADAIAWHRLWGTNEYPNLNTAHEVLELPSTDIIVLGETNEFQTPATNYAAANYNICLSRFTAAGSLDSMVSYSIEEHFASSGYDFVRKNDMLYIVGQTTSEFSPTICIHGFVFQVDTAFMGIEIKEFWKTPGPIITKISTCTGMGISYNPVLDKLAITGYILDDTLLPQYNGFTALVTPVLTVTAFNVHGEGAGNQFFVDVVTDSNRIHAVGNDWGDMGVFGTPADWYSVKTIDNLRSCNEVRTSITYEKPKFESVVNFPQPYAPDYLYYSDEAYSEIGTLRQLCSNGESTAQTGGGHVLSTIIFNIMGQRVEACTGTGIYIICKQMSDGTIETNKVIIVK